MNSQSSRAILQQADSLRWEIGGQFHQDLMEAIYTDAAHIADRAVTRPDQKPRFDLDKVIDGLVTSRLWGFPIMLLLLIGVFWLTISGANLPSAMLASLLIEDFHPVLKGLAASVVLTGRFGDEATLLRLSAQLKAARPWKDRHPPNWY